MKKDYTHITVILDRSGSMGAIRENVIAGFNDFLKEQKHTQGMATLSLIQFDTVSPYEVIHAFTLVQAVRPLTLETYVPRGGTPLLDAVGHGINNLASILDHMRAEDRPEHVIFVIVTDGMENASCEFTFSQITQMFAEKAEMLGWQFVFLSSDGAAVAEAEAMGIRFGNTLNFDKTAAGSKAAFSSVSANVARVRRHEAASAEFTHEDRAAHQNEQRRGKQP